MDKIFTTAPANNNRLPKEMQVYELLEKLQIPFERMDHEVADTMEACQKIDEKLQVTMCKNLFLCNRQKTNFFLLLMPGDKKFLTKDLSKQLGISRLSFAEAEFMEKFLDITPGSVSVLGLMNDSQKEVTLLIDQDLLKDEYIGCHPCINTSSLKIKTSDILEKFLVYTGHTPTLVTL
ncbi:prolyl-tRNA synthetase associated domain-containing protein [Faecalimonas canis]